MKAGLKCGVKAPSPPAPHFASLPALPTDQLYSIDWGRNSPSWPMLGNDKHSNCIEASIFHFLQAIGSYSENKGYYGTESECLKNYSDWFGFNPNNSQTDSGGVPSEAFEFWLKKGLFIDGSLDYPLAVFKTNPKDLNNIKMALAYFGPLLVVAGLPQNIDGQEIWGEGGDASLSNQLASEGYHQMALLAFPDSGPKFSTWNMTQNANNFWWENYIVEAWAVLHPVWLASGKTPAGFDYTSLISEAKSLFNSQVS